MLIPEGLTEADLPRIEEEMVRLSKESLPVERQVMTKEDAKKLFQSLNEPFKVELIEEIEAIMLPFTDKESLWIFAGSAR